MLIIPFILVGCGKKASIQGTLNNILKNDLNASTFTYDVTDTETGDKGSLTVNVKRYSANKEINLLNSTKRTYTFEVMEIMQTFKMKNVEYNQVKFDERTRELTFDIGTLNTRYDVYKDGIPGKIDEKKKDLIKKGDKIYQKSKKLDNFINTNKTAIGTIKSLVYEGEIPQNDEEANNESFLNAIIIENDNTKAILRIKDEVWEFKRVDIK